MKLKAFIKDRKDNPPPPPVITPPATRNRWSSDLCGKCGFKRSDHTDRTHPFVEQTEDEEMLLQSIVLRQGWCPSCNHRVTSEVDANDKDVIWYNCERNQLHFYEVNHRTGVVTSM